jgi:hypothetical protein
MSTNLKFWDDFFDKYLESWDTEVFLSDNSELVHEAKRRAMGWNYCACCELKVERRKALNHDGIAIIVDPPLNQELDKLGFDFNKCMYDNDFTGAWNVFQKIQVIVAEENKL